MQPLIVALLVSASVLLSSAAAGAASLASGQKLKVKVDPNKVDVETAALWQHFGGWCAIAEWQPAVKKCEESKEGDNVFRTLTLGNGGKIKEKLLDETLTSYRYSIIEKSAAGQKLRGAVLDHTRCCRSGRSQHRVVRNLRCRRRQGRKSRSRVY